MTSAASAVPQGVMRMLELALSAACAASVRVAVTLGLPDALGDVAATVDELAEVIEVRPDILRRLLRSLICHGVFAEETDGRYVHTEASRLLREDAPHSVKYLVLWCTEPWTWELWGHLEEAVRTGKNIFFDLHGKDFFEHLHAEWPESAEVFDVAMTQSSQQSALAIAEMLTMTGVQTIADIGGGQGHVLATLLERHPTVQGALFDLPDVVANADARLRAGGELASRVRLLPGDCREKIPVQADIYIFKNVLGWDDEGTVLVLRNAVKAAKPGARVVIIENLVDSGPGQKVTTAMDLRLLLSVGGKKRTKEGLIALVERSGLIIKNVQSVDSLLHMIETAVPA
jgi:C-methyltransferase